MLSVPVRGVEEEEGNVGRFKRFSEFVLAEFETVPRNHSMSHDFWSVVTTDVVYDNDTILLLKVFLEHRVPQFTFSTFSVSLTSSSSSVGREVSRPSL